MSKSLGVVLVCAVSACTVRGADPHVAPRVSNVRVEQEAGTKRVHIWYDVATEDPSDLIVCVEVSTNGGATFDLPLSGLAMQGSGYGDLTTPGNNLHIEWDAGTDWRLSSSSNLVVKVTADNGFPTEAPPDMKLVRGGSSVLGNDSDTPPSDRSPAHSIELMSYYVSMYEVSNKEVADLFRWAWDEYKVYINTSSREVSYPYSPPRTLLFRYGDASSSAQIEWYGRLRAVPGKEDHPCVGINWYGALVYCNLKSELAGMTPCYDLSSWRCDFSASGYRLPTEAEWETAAQSIARGGSSVFPWGGSTIDHDRCNYYSTNALAYDVSVTRGHHPSYSGGSKPYTSPGDAFSGGGWPLFQMAGNAAEWCWDWYQNDRYQWSIDTYEAYLLKSDPHIPFPRGPAAAPSLEQKRVVRGGSWNDTADRCDFTARHRADPSVMTNTIGFRTVRTPD